LPSIKTETKHRSIVHQKKKRTATTLTPSHVKRLSGSNQIQDQRNVCCFFHSQIVLGHSDVWIASKRATPVIQSLSESESDDFDFGTSKARRKKRKLTQLPSAAEVRFSTRAANKVTNYNEDDDFSDELKEEIDETDPAYYMQAEADNVPTIDVVLDHRVKEGLGMICIHLM